MKKFLLFASLVTVMMVYACQKDSLVQSTASTTGIATDRGDTLHHHHGPCDSTHLDSLHHHHFNPADSIWHSHLDSLIHHHAHDSFPPPPPGDTTGHGPHGGPGGPHGPGGPGGPHGPGGPGGPGGPHHGGH